MDGFMWLGTEPLENHYNLLSAGWLPGLPAGNRELSSHPLLHLSALLEFMYTILGNKFIKKTCKD